MKVLVLNGLNLNLLGERNPNIYGNETYSDLIQKIKDRARELDVEVCFFQSNCEGKLIDRLQEARLKENAVIFNPGAYSHTSIALMDAIDSINIPCVEVHISNIYKREDYRQKSITAKACKASVVGLGTDGYLSALEAIYRMNIK